MEYQQMVSRILEVTSIREHEIFDFELSPHSREFNDAYNFYYEAISRHSNYGVGPYLLFYKDDRTVNAAAGKENGHYVIYINAGTIVYLIEKFRDQEIILNDEYKDFEPLLDVTIANLMYNTALHFTFYHELGHLIQKSELLNDKLFEQPNNEDVFSIDRHILELDADAFSSLCLGTHILQYANKQFDSDVNSDNIKRLIVVACGSALLYLLSFQTNVLPIYYEESTHPHPVIRITCVVFHIVGYCNQALKERGLELNVKEIINESMSFAHSISSTGNERSIIEKYQEVIGQEANNIEVYLRKTRSIQQTDTSLSTYKWNLQLHGRNV